jgi:hypothetical protein
VFPYLSPITKFGLSVYGDFARTKTLFDHVPDCTATYLGQAVPNCFLRSYRSMAEKRAFASPAFGVVFETQYRQSVMMNRLKADSALESVALNAVTLDNLVTLLEPNELVYDRSKFLHPLGLLAFYGSPELPAIGFGQDLQHIALSKKLLPMVISQLSKLTKSLDDMKGALTPSDESAAREKLSALSTRIKVLETDPLALRPEAAPAERPTGP